MSAALLDPTKPAWPDEEAVVLAVTDPSRYNDSLVHVCRQLMARFQDGLVLTANRPATSLRDTLQAAGLDTDRLRFLDCVTGLTGMAPPPDPQILHVESPTLLEKVALRTEQGLRRLGASRFLVVDSLSTLAVYNGDAAVAEWTHNLVVRLRVQRIPAGLLLVQQTTSRSLLERVRPLCDGPVQL